MTNQSILEKTTESVDDNVAVTELPEDMEIVGPGQILAQARAELGLSKQDIANRLNFHMTLLDNIEADCYDSSLPETFNRGYLRSYAKLVNISEVDILASYEMLSVAKIQCAEMQSFSRVTQKEAQNNRLMWVSYFIVALLIGSTVMWWMQESEDKIAVLKNTSVGEISKADVLSVSNTVQHDSDKPKTAELSESKNVNLKTESSKVDQSKVNESKTDSVETPSSELNAAATVNVKTDNLMPQSSTIVSPAINNKIINNEIINDKTNNDIPMISQVVFTFSGDCWVNIYDDTGERIAWGVKKSGYVMSISGIAPFKITVGKPELAVINFNGQLIDMSKFNSGNIAKFTLPLSE